MMMSNTGEEEESVSVCLECGCVKQGLTQHHGSVYYTPFLLRTLFVCLVVYLFCFSSMMCRVAAFSDSTVVLLQRMNKMTLWWMLRCEDAASSCVQFFSVPALLLLISPVPSENCSVFSLIVPYSLRTLAQLIF